MTLSAYWWSPWRDRRSLAGELLHHRSAWLRLSRRGGRPFANFGDEITPWLVDELTGIRPRWSAMKAADLVCVGSILDRYVRDGASGYVLGSGVRDPIALQGRSIDLERVLLVRGSMTRELLGASATLPLGDPGLILGEMLVPSRRREGVVVVPHFTELASAASLRHLDAASTVGWRVLLPNMHPMHMGRSIARASLVVTSSLHGLVFADALGVPAQLVTMSAGSHSEPRFKYSDYSSSLGVEDHSIPIEKLLVEPDRSRMIDRLESRSSVVASRLGEVITGIYKAAQTLR